MNKKMIDIRELKRQAHALKPVVWVGSKGLSENVLAEIDLALDSHELIKVKVVCEKEERPALLDEIVSQSQATLVGTIGQICILYREIKESS